MKSKLLFSGLVVLGLSSKAQFGQQGQRLIGGEFRFSHESNKTPFDFGAESTLLNLSVSRGVFRKPNVLTSFFIYFGVNDYEQRNSGGNIIKNAGNQGGVGYGQTWYKPLGKNFFFGLNGSASAGLSYSEHNNGGGSSETTSRGYTIGVALQPVLSYQLSNRFVANITSSNFLALNYNYTRSKAGNVTNNTIHKVNLNTGFWNAPLDNISIGFSYLLKRK